MKKAIIIGGSSGIGEKLAELLAENGYRVAITGRREALLQQIAERNQDKIIYRVFDVKHTAELENHLADTATQLGGCDLLIISAGTGDLNEQLEFAVEKEIITTNVAGFTCVADWAFRFFQSQTNGHLVAISSVAGMRGYRGAPAYNASKAYQISYLQALSQKAAKEKKGPVVTDVRPGFVNTKMAKGPGQFSVASPEKAAGQIYTAIKRKKKVVYITRRWRLIGILLRILPRFIFEKL